MVVLGIGGVLAEIYHDFAVRLAPVSVKDADAMIDEVKGLAVIRGYRGMPKGDRDALARAVSAFSQLAFIDSVAEAEINPLIVKREGEGVVAVDGLIRAEMKPGGTRRRNPCCISKLLEQIAAIKEQTSKLPDEVIHHAKRAVIDWYAALLPGSIVAPATLLEQAFAEDLDRGRARLATGRRATLRAAALINGAASHSVEFDDIYRDAGYHPGSPVISAALAAAQATGASGETFSARRDRRLRSLDAHRRSGDAVALQVLAHDRHRRLLRRRRPPSRRSSAATASSSCTRSPRSARSPRACSRLSARRR